MFTFHHPRPVVSRRPVAEMTVRHAAAPDVRDAVLVAKASPEAGAAPLAASTGAGPDAAAPAST